MNWVMSVMFFSICFLCPFANVFWRCDHAANLVSRLVILHFLPGHVTSETSLNLSSSLVCSWVIKGNVHDVLILRLSAFFLQFR